MKKILTTLTLLLISALFFACSDSKDTPPPPPPPEPVEKAILEVTATLDLTATEKNPTRTGEITLADLTYVITNTDTQKEVDKGSVPADGKLKALTLDPGTYSVAITSHATGEPKPAFDTPSYGKTETVVLKADDNTKLEVKSTQQNAGIHFTYGADLADAVVVATITHADGTLTYAANDDKKIGYFSPAVVEASFTVDGTPIKVNDKDKETLTLKAGELWNIKLSKTAESGAWVLLVPETGIWLKGGTLDVAVLTSNKPNFSIVSLDLRSTDDKLNMFLSLNTKPTTFPNVEVAVGEYTITKFDLGENYEPMTFAQGEWSFIGARASVFLEYEDIEESPINIWVPDSGKIVVSKAGEIYTIKVTFSGMYYDDVNMTKAPFADLTWNFKGKLDDWGTLTRIPPSI